MKAPKSVTFVTIPGIFIAVLTSLIVFNFESNSNSLAFCLGSLVGFFNSFITSLNVYSSVVENSENVSVFKIFSFPINSII